MAAAASRASASPSRRRRIARALRSAGAGPTRGQGSALGSRGHPVDGTACASWVSRQLEEITLTDQQEPRGALRSGRPPSDAPVLLVPRWIQLIVAAGHPALRMDLRRGRPARAVRVPGLGHHRDAAQSARLDARRRCACRAGSPCWWSTSRSRPCIVGAVGARGRRGRQPGDVGERRRSRRSSRSSRASRSPRPSAASTASRTGSTPAASSRVHVKDIGNRLVENIQKKGVDEYAKRAVDIGQQVAAEVVQGVIELLLDTRDLDLPAARRAAHSARPRPRVPARLRRHPPRPPGAERTDPLCAGTGDRVAADRRERGRRHRDPLADRRLARGRSLRADPRASGRP